MYLCVHSYDIENETHTLQKSSFLRFHSQFQGHSVIESRTLDITVGIAISDLMYIEGRSSD